MPNLQYTNNRRKLSPRKKDHTNNRREPSLQKEGYPEEQSNFRKRQVRVAYRRIAGVFGVNNGAIWAGRGSIEDLIAVVCEKITREARVIGGLERPEDHKAIYQHALELLVADGEVYFKKGCAVIDPDFAQAQKNLSRDYRDRSREGRPPSKFHKGRDYGRRGVAGERERRRLTV